MPVIKSAIKKERRDRKVEKRNNDFRAELQSVIRKAKKIKTAQAISKAFSLIDKGVKHNIIRKNKASRLKSTLSKLAKPVSKARETIVKTKTSKVSKKLPAKRNRV